LQNEFLIPEILTIEPFSQALTICSHSSIASLRSFVIIVLLTYYLFRTAVGAVDTLFKRCKPTTAAVAIVVIIVINC
jgi:hypothetical protein